jgi:hypothetical protein
MRRCGEPGSHEAGIDALLIDVAYRLLDQPGKRLRRFGALASRLIRLERRLGGGAGLIGPPGMDDEAEKHQRDQAELVKQEVRNPDDVSIHKGERRQFYPIRSLPIYPLPISTGPFRRLLYHDGYFCIKPRKGIFQKSTAEGACEVISVND